VKRHPIHALNPQLSLVELSRISSADYLRQLYRLPLHFMKNRHIIKNRRPDHEAGSGEPENNISFSCPFKGRAFSLKGVEEEGEKRWTRNLDLFNAEPAAKLKEVDLLTACFSFVNENPEQRKVTNGLIRREIFPDLLHNGYLWRRRMTDRALSDFCARTLVYARSNHLPLTGSCSPTGTSRRVRGRSPGCTLPGGRAILPSAARLPKLHF
jgi:hypothetical protein